MITENATDDYSLLLADISALYESNQSLLTPSAADDQRRIELYWEIGRRIVDVVPGGKERGTWGQGVLRRLSEDLTQKYGKGFQARTVQYLRRFALLYPRAQIQTGLNWSHYRALLTVEDPQMRLSLGARALAEKLTKEQLLILVNSEIRKSNGPPVFLFESRKAAIGIFKVVLDPTTAKPLLDLGFNVTRELPIKGERNLQEGEFLQFKGIDRFSRIACEPGERYCYRGETVKVIDGDTVKMRMSLGFGTYVNETMRLRGVDADEIDTDEGKKAHRALARMLKGAKTITVFTYSHDRYGRYIADLFVDGKYINKDLVESGTARFLKM